MKRKLLLSFLTLCISATAFAQGNSGLVAHWDFNGTTNDVSGHGLNGTPLAITYGTGFTGNPNKAAYFKGYDNTLNDYAYVNVPYSPGMNVTQFSICALVKTTAFYNGLCQGNGVLWRGSQYSNDFYFLQIFDNAFDNDCNTYSPNNEVFNTAAGPAQTVSSGLYYNNPVLLSEWACVTTTFNGDSVKVYVNGALQTKFKYQYTLASSTNGIAIGRNFSYTQGGQYPYPFTGYIDDIRLYNRPLSAQEAGMYCDSVKMIPTAVAEIPENEELLLYPNPATKSITVQVPDGWKNVSYTLQNGMGQQVQAQVLTGKTTSIDMENLPTGIYMIRFTAGDKIISRKIVKQ